MKYGIEAFIAALDIIPKTLMKNAGIDSNEKIPELDNAISNGQIMGIDVTNGSFIYPEREGILDNYCVIRQMLTSSIIIASNLLLVDEIVRAGKNLK